MNSCLSKLLRPSHRRILKISSSSKMMTTTRTLQGCEKSQSPLKVIVDEFLKNYVPPKNKIQTVPSFLPPSYFEEDDYFFDDYDDYPAFLPMIPLLNRVIHRFKSIENVIAKLHSYNLYESDPDSHSYMFLVLLRLLSHAGKHDVLLDAYHHIVNYCDFVPNTFASNLLMDSLFTTGQSQSAFSVFKQIYSPDFFTFDIALFHLSHLNNDIANISHVLTHMLRMPCYPSHDTFNKLLYSFCKMDAIPQVNQLLGLMVVKLGFEISVNVWAVLVTKFVRERSLSRIDAMISQGFVPDEEGTSAMMQIHDTFCDLLYSVCKMNAMPQAFQIFGLMVHNLGIDFSINVWTSLVTKFIQEGRSGALLNQMFSEGFLPDKGKSVAKVYAICDEVATAATSGVFQVRTLDYCDYQTSPLFSLQTEVHSRGLAT